MPPVLRQLRLLLRAPRPFRRQLPVSLPPLLPLPLLRPRQYQLPAMRRLLRWRRRRRRQRRRQCRRLSRVRRASRRFRSRQSGRRYQRLPWQPRHHTVAGRWTQAVARLILRRLQRRQRMRGRKRMIPPLRQRQPPLQVSTRCPRARLRGGAGHGGCR